MYLASRHQVRATQVSSLQTHSLPICLSDVTHALLECKQLFLALRRQHFCMIQQLMLGLSVCQPVSLSAFAAYLSIRLFVCLPASLCSCLHGCLLSSCPSVCLPACLSIYLPLWLTGISQLACLSVCLTWSLSAYMSATHCHKPSIVSIVHKNVCLCVGHEARQWPSHKHLHPP